MKYITGHMDNAQCFLRWRVCQCLLIDKLQNNPMWQPRMSVHLGQQYKLLANLTGHEELWVNYHQLRVNVLFNIRYVGFMLMWRKNKTFTLSNIHLQTPCSNSEDP